MSALEVSEECEQIQDKIMAVHTKQMDETRKLALEAGVKKNPNFAARTAVLKSSGPKDFWARVLKAHPDLSSQLIGEYDDRIFEALESFDVEHKAKGFRIEMKFRPNDYFSDETLWYEEEEEAGKDTVPRTSGVQWKSGKGPMRDDSCCGGGDNINNSKQQQEEGGESASAGRREREPEGRGGSFFSFFEEVEPNPEEQLEKEQQEEGNNNNNNNNKHNNNNNNNDEQEGGDDMDEGFGDFDDNANDSMDQIMDDWLDMIDERRDVARCLVEEIWEDPASLLQ